MADRGVGSGKSVSHRIARSNEGTETKEGIIDLYASVFVEELNEVCWVFFNVPGPVELSPLPALEPEYLPP